MALLSDGRLSFEEFLGEETHIDKIFRTMDKDNDGFVTKEVKDSVALVLLFYSWHIFPFIHNCGKIIYTLSITTKYSLLNMCITFFRETF